MRISEREIEKIIDEENVIGRGAYSVLYKGSRPGGKTEGETFAIKALSPVNNGEGNRSQENLEQLLREVRTLAQIRNRNVLRVLSFCSGKEIKAIILEYMPQGSLHKHLYPEDGGACRLSFQSRLDIALGTAEGMKYLHHDLDRPLIHGDLKPTNILLDEDFNAKVADFGLAKFVREQRGGGVGQDATASAIYGTVGYIPPEYAFEGRVSTKGDSFSYGVVLLEILTGTPASGHPIDNEESLLLHANEDLSVRAANEAAGSDHPEPDPSEGYRSRILKLYEENSFQMMDAKLQEQSESDSLSREQMKLTLLVALLCTGERPQSRPTMSDVCAILTEVNGMRTDVVAATRTIAELLNEAPEPAPEEDLGLSSA